MRVGERLRRDRRDLTGVFLASGVVLVLVGMFVFAFGSVSGVARRSFPFDFNVNWVAAQRFVDGQQIYDHAASSAQAVESLGQQMRVSHSSPFVSYIGPPSTALMHVVFLPLGHRAAVTGFRIFAVVGMLGALVMTARILPARARLGGFLLGVGALLVSFPLANTIALGQGHEFVMLGLAAGIWGVRRERWGIAGVGLGVATVLKVSPVLLIVDLLVRGYRRPALWAALTTAVLTASAAMVGRPLEIWIWMRDVAPEVGRGSLHVWNQALVGWIARITADGNASLGVQTTLSRAWGLFCLRLGGRSPRHVWRFRRRTALVPLELGVVVLVALAVGPLTWEHYLVWAYIPFVLCFDPTLWRGWPGRTYPSCCDPKDENDVVFARPDGTRLPVFPALAPESMIDCDTCSEEERMLLLVVIGSGLVRRTRRGGVLAQSLFQPRPLSRLSR